MNGCRFYFDKDIDFLFEEEKKYNSDYVALRAARNRLRMYANLFTRSLRGSMITDSSVCSICRSTEKLQLDHIIPVSKGGLNDPANIQVLCQRCNAIKSNKL